MEGQEWYEQFVASLSLYGFPKNGYPLLFLRLLS